MNTSLNRNFKIRGDISCLYQPGSVIVTKQIENIEVQLWHKTPMQLTLLGKGITNSDGEFTIEFEIDSPVDYIVDGKIKNAFLEAYYNGELLNAPSYDEDAILYFDQLDPQPSPFFKSAVNILIKQLKSDNNWQYIDRFWIHASEFQQNAKISLRNPTSKIITEIDSPTWTTKVGYTGNGTSSYLDTHFIPSESGQLFALNSSMFGCYQTANVAISTGNLIGSTTSSVLCFIQPRYTGDAAIQRNNTNSSFSTSSNSDARGSFTSVRTASDRSDLFKNGVSISNVNTASTILSTGSFQILSNGIGTNLYNGTAAMTWIGNSSVNQGTFYSAIQAFATTIGFNV